ncbi:MAG: hypothetical protein ACPW61_06240 [Methyloligella sp. ZOD6]
MARPATKESEGTSKWEWALAAVGAAVIVAAIGYLLWYGVTRSRSVPELTISKMAVRPIVGDNFLVVVKIKNKGSSTAANVEIGGTLMEAGAPIEEGQAGIDYVPAHSSRQAYLQFSKDPADYRLELRVKGMTKP